MAPRRRRGEARRTEHAQCARPALGARRKRSSAVIPAAALGYAVPASVAAASRRAQHLPLGPRRPSVAAGAPLWVSGARRLGPWGPRVTVDWSSGCKVVIQHLKPPPTPLTLPVPPACGPDCRVEVAPGLRRAARGRQRGALPGEDCVRRAGES